MEVEQRSTIAVSAWCSMHQLPGCKCAMKRSHAPLRCQDGAYMSIYGYMQLCIHGFISIYILKTKICIMLHLMCIYLWFYAYVYADIYVYRCILACIWSCPTSLLYWRGESPTTPGELHKTAKCKQNIRQTLPYLASASHLEVQDNKRGRRECKEAIKSKNIMQVC